MANLVFDFDGTLADTFPFLVDVSYKLSSGTKRLPKEDIEKLRRIPLLTALRSLGIPWFHIPRLMFSTRRNLAPHMQEVKPFAGVSDVIEELHRRKHRLFILSSNYAENIKVFLVHNKLDQYFDGIETVQFANTFTKTYALTKMIKNYNLNRSEMYHVGNEVLDMRSAAAVGIKGVATTWGGFNPDRLKRIEPFAIIDKPQELLGLVGAGKAAMR